VNDANGEGVVLPTIQYRKASKSKMLQNAGLTFFNNQLLTTSTLIQNMSMCGNLFLKQDDQITLDAEAKEILRIWA
jgi:hypothetical protein